MESDEEDYENLNKIEEYDENRGTIKEMYEAQEEERQRSKYNKEEINQVFTKNVVTLNAEDKFEFPDLHGKRRDAEEKVGQVEEKGWNNLDSLVINNNKSKQERLMQEFPDLVEEQGPSLLTKMKSQAEPKKPLMSFAK